MYDCDLCGHKDGSLDKYMTHIAGHRNVHNFQFKCGACTNIYCKYSSLALHYRRKHCSPVFKNCDSNVIHDRHHYELQCNYTLCGKNLPCFSELVKHLKNHIVHNVTVTCPYIDCGAQYSKVSSFSSHLSRKHTSSSYATSNGTIENSDVVSSCLPRVEHMKEISDSAVAVVNNETGDNFLTTGSLSEHNISDSLIAKSFALFLLKLESKFLVPQSTIQAVVDELGVVTELCRKSLQVKLSQVISDDATLSSVSGMLRENSLSSFCDQSSGQLCSGYRRHQVYQKLFQFIAPVQVFLGNDRNGKACFVMYVPVRETLTAFLQNSSLQTALTSMPLKSDLLCDYTDGSLFSNAGTIDLFLFQDAFEIANPLGSSRKKHKLLAVYGVLGNLPSQYRYKTENIFLVMLFKEKQLKAFGHERVFNRLLSELNDLEVNGMSFNSSVAKLRLCALLGDNMGSHCVGGFTENFCGEYFCRYCLATQQQFREDPCCLGPRRDKSSYSDAIVHLQNSSEVSYQGIKFDSVFNRLDSFHVCNPGLPPCAGHDLFEGIVACDLALFIKYFVKLKWFTYDQLNERIMQFQYAEYDATSKPPIVACNSKRLVGQAMENWCLLRLFPIIILDKIDDVHDEVWDLLLTLREIVELVCSPKLSVAQVSYMAVIIAKYLSLRLQNFPNERLKPKHHFMQHYPSLTRMYGPLIRMWTMRFESKHSYFKRCARNFCNFKNPESTLAKCHQLFQSYIHNGQILKQICSFSGSKPIGESRVSSDIVMLMQQSGFTQMNTVTVTSVKIHGTCYKPGLFVAVKRSEMLELLMSKIVHIIVKEARTVYFIVVDHKVQLAPGLGVYEILQPVSDCYCIESDFIADYMPLLPYHVQKNSFVVLKHALC